MAKTKAELEQDRNEYYKLLDAARHAEREGCYGDAIRTAMESCKHVDGMMQFERRHENREFDSIDSIDLILGLAPLLLDYDALNELEELLGEVRRIEKNTSADLGEKLGTARAALQAAYRLWDCLERHPGAAHSELDRALDDLRTFRKATIEAWLRINVIRRLGHGRNTRYELSTQLDAPTRAKCSSCGAIVRIPKFDALEHRACPGCSQGATFVLLGETSDEPNGDRP